MKTYRAVIDGPAPLLADTASLYFDIETTGLSAHSSQLYLIGACRSDGERFVLTQWFAEELLDERAVLDAFFAELSGCSRLVHYNGAGFDIPYLTDCVTQYRLPHSFESVESVDLFRSARKLKKLLGAENCRLKTVERLFGLAREDEKSGGELIGEYLDWCGSRDPSLLTDLLLHNFEDVANLPKIAASLAAYEGLADRAWRCAYETAPDALLVTLTDEGLAFPAACRAQAGSTQIALADGAVTLRFPLAYGEHRHYYPDYKNYDYLPAQDTAMLKTLSRYLDPSKRVRATAATCYTRHEGLFIEEPCAGLLPDLTDAPKAKTHYALFRPEAFTEADALTLARAVLRML